MSLARTARSDVAGIALTVSRLAPSQRVEAGFAGADPHDLLDRNHPHLAVTDASRACRLDDPVDDRTFRAVLAEDLQLHLRDEVDRVLGAAVHLGVSPLPAETLY